MTRQAYAVFGVLLLLATQPALAAGPDVEKQYQEGAAAFARDDKAQALKILRPLAEAGHAGAQQKLAVLYAMGHGGVARDYKQALKWYQNSAAGGNADAQHQLATAYRNGDYGLQKDYAQALKWFRAAADQGHASARLSLAVMFENAWGTEKNIDETLRLRRLAAEQGSADGQVALGRMYEKGEGVAQSYPEAAKWYRKAADQGSYMGQYHLKALPASAAAPVTAPVAAPAAAPVVAPAVTASAPTSKPAAVVTSVPSSPPVAVAATQAPAVKPAAVPASPPKSSLVHTPITDPAAFLAARNSQIPPAPGAVSDNDFGVEKAPVAVRGKSLPITDGKPEYGYKYTDVNGWYIFILPNGWSWERDKNDPRAAHFWGNSGKNQVSCGVTPMDYWRGKRSLVELQAIPESEARGVFEKGLMETLGWDQIDKRSTLMLLEQRIPIRLLSWGNAARNGSYETAAIVESPANTLLIICNANQQKTSENVIRIAFGLAEGALIPANMTASSGKNTGKSTVAMTASQQENVKKMVAESRVKRALVQQQLAGSGASRVSDERQKLQQEFESALARKDRDTIYRIGPKIKDIKFCQYVYNDPSATKQQLYDGASSCPSGPVFDALTQRYIQSLPPLASSVSGSGYSPNTTYSPPTSYTPAPVYDPYQAKRSMDYEIRQMNKRIDDAGR